MQINIQSFGDIITNSSSEVYCLYDWDGMEQIENAIKNIVKVINPEINIDEHLEFSLVPDDYDYWEDDNGNEVSYQEFYNQEFGKYCERNQNNEDILLNFPDWYRSFIQEHSFNDGGIPNFKLNILPKSELGETLAKQIENILYAFAYKEIYT